MHPLDVVGQAPEKRTCGRSDLDPAAPQNYNEAPILQARLAAMELVVNLSDGGPKSKVWFRVDGGPAVEMVRSARVGTP